jgi:hypothetical protein
MSDPEFKKDADGNIIVKPAVGWVAGPVAGIAVLLQMHS